MGGHRAFWALTTALLAALLLFACGQSSRREVSTSTIPASASLSDVLADLAEMQAPDGVDAAVFRQLKDALRASLTARGIDKISCTPPTGPANAVPDLAMVDSGDGTANLSWRYYNLGDYNQDGTVGIADITPLAIHFGQSWFTGEENTLPAVVDGSGNGLVDIADITPIAMNFGVEAARYDIQSSDAENGTYTSVQTVPLADGVDKDTARMSFSVNITPTLSYWYRVAPLDSASSQGVPSNAVRLGAPIASIVPDITTGVIPFTVSFDASASYDPDGTIVKYEWDFEGDGIYDLDSGNTPSASCNYTVANTYRATVRVTDDDGLQSTAFVIITALAAGQPPTAFIVPDITSGTVPLTVNFDASASFDPDGAIVKYEWDYEGDGIYDMEGADAQHAFFTYGVSGVFNPTVRVTGNDGLQDTASVSIQASDVSQPPVASIVPDIDHGETPLTVSFDASGSYDPDGEIVKYEWDLDEDGVYELDTSTTPSTSTTYFSYGYYHPFVRVTDDDGLQATASTTIIASFDPWVHTWGQNVEESGTGVDVDSLGNIYMSGLSLSLSTISLVAKYAPSGVPEWVKSYSTGSTSDGLMDIAVDNSDNIIACGGRYDSVNSNDAFLIKFDSTGTLLWQEGLGGTGTDRAYAVDTDDLNNIYMAGYTESFPQAGAIIAKFDPSGNVIWEYYWSLNGGECAYNLVIDDYGNVYVVIEAAFFTPTFSYNVILLKFDTDGNPLWQKCWDVGYRDLPQDVAVDGVGYVYVVGNTEATSMSIADIFLIKYDPSGTLASQQIWDGGNFEYAARVAVDNNSGNVYVGGGIDFQGDPIRKMLLLQYNASGSPVKQEIWGGSENAMLNGLAFSGQGAVFMAGYSPNANLTRSSITGTALEAFGVSSDVSGTFNSPGWTPVALGGSLVDQAGTIDTGGGVSDLLIAKENPWYW